MSESRPTTQLNTAATELASIARALGLPSLASSICDDTRRRLENGRLRVLCLGEVNHGKSSLINALLGQSILPVGVTPTTSAVVSLRTGDDPRYFSTDEDGGVHTMDKTLFDAFARGKLPIKGRVEGICEPTLLPEAIEFIDTPGFNDIDHLRSKIGRSELPRADVLILVLDASQVLTRSELNLLREAISAVGGLPDSGATLELVINRIDLIAEEDRPALVAHVRTQLAELLGERPKPYLTDARRALQHPDEDTAPAADLRRLRARLRELADVRAQILPARARTSLLRHGQLLSYNAAIQARALTLKKADLAKEIAAVEHSLADQALDTNTLRQGIHAGRKRVLEASARRIATAHDDLVRRATEQIKGSDLRKLTDVVPGALQDAFLEILRLEADSLRRDLEDLTDELMRTHGELAQRRLADATLQLGFRGPSIYVELPSLKVEAGMMALGIVGTAVMYLGNTSMGLVMTIASPLTTMLLREKSLRDGRRQAVEAMPAAIASTFRALRSTVDEVVGDYLDGLELHLELANEALGEQLLSSLHRAQEQTATPESTTENSPTPQDFPRSQALARGELETLEHRLEALRNTLLRLDLGSIFRDPEGVPHVIH